MYTNDLNVSDYNTRFYTVSINAAWIKIRDAKTKEVLTERRADVVPHGWPDNWYDERHRAVMNALHALETAIFAMVDADKK